MLANHFNLRRIFLISYFSLLHCNVFAQKRLPSVIALPDDLLSEQVSGESNQIIGYLGMNQNTFLKTVAFAWGGARFSVKGYDNTQKQVFLNGVLTNALDTGMPVWSAWSGLNDVFRQTQLSKGLEPFAEGMGGLGITTKMDTNPFLQRLGSKVSYVFANATYQTRLMITHTTPFYKDWRMVVSVSKRYGKSGFIQGTFYDAWSGFLSLGKQFLKHQIYFTALSAFTKSGKYSPYTQEVFDMKGRNYNSNWGIQNGKVRSARYREVFQPILMLTHRFESKKFSLQTTLSHQFGNRSDARLGYQKTISPDPSYYQKMPSYYLRFSNVTSAKAKAYDALKDFEKNGQIDWKEMYQINKINKQSLYYMYADQNFDTKWNLHSILKYNFNEKWKGSVAFLNTYLQRKSAAIMLDLLGGNFALNTDGYQQGNAKYYNLQKPDQTIQKDDIFQYNYIIEARKMDVFIKQTYHSKYLDFYTAFSLNQIISQREGLFQNGKYPDVSLGFSSPEKFTGFSLKMGGLFKFTNRHLFSLNTAFLKVVPILNEIYVNPREHHKTFENIALQNQYSCEGTYDYKGKMIDFGCTFFYTLFENDAEKQFTYVSDHSSYEDDFSVQYLKNVQKRHMGLEFYLTTKPIPELQINVTGNWGSYQYTNAPELFLYNAKGITNLGKASLQGYHIADSPEDAWGIEFYYKSPSYWSVGLNMNYIFDRYIKIAPLLRTDSFWKDSDGVPFLDEKNGKHITSKQVSNLLYQERLAGVFLCNLVGSKSWKIQKHYISLFISINNLLDKIYKTGGFEQSRNASYLSLLEDIQRQIPIFGKKYWQGRGTTYYLMLSWSF